MGNINIAHVETWDETKPSGTRDRSLGDDDIREFKRSIRERLSIDHNAVEDESGDANIGTHKKITLAETQVSDPTAYDDCGYLYIKEVSGIKELFWEDSDGNVVQLTSGGKLTSLGSQGFRTGDKLLSSNTDTPTGWTDQSATYTDNFIRISSGTPLTSGGSNTHNHGAATGSTTLTAAQSGLPAHSHTFKSEASSNTGVVGDNARTVDSSTGTGSTNASSAANASEGHTHSVASADNIPVYIQLKMYSKN